MNGSIRAFLWGFAGVLLAALLSLGAFAIADSRISGPRERPLLRPIEPTVTAAASPGSKPSKDDEPDRPSSTASPLTDPDDEPGDDNSGHGSEPGDDDSSGHGSDDGPDDD
jgi:hypothetical protein